MARRLLIGYIVLLAALGLKGLIPATADLGFYGRDVGEWSMYRASIDIEMSEVEPLGVRPEAWMWHSSLVAASSPVLDQRVLDRLAAHIAGTTGEGNVTIRLVYKVDRDRTVEMVGSR